MRFVSSLFAAGLLATCLAACGGTGPETESPSSAPQGAGARPPVMGSFRIGETSHEFRVSRCDLTGNEPILLRGGGTLPDGRTFGVEVERMMPEVGGPGWPYEQAAVNFGSPTDDDGWEATAMTMDGSRWTDGNAMREIAGPIITVSGNDVVVAGTFEHVSRDEQAVGELRVTCPAPTYP